MEEILPLGIYARDHSFFVAFSFILCMCSLSEARKTKIFRNESKTSKRFENLYRLLMSTQILEPIGINGGVHLNFAEATDPVLWLLEELLNEVSKLKKNTNHNPETINAAVNVILGAILMNGNWELMSQLFNMIRNLICHLFQHFAVQESWSEEELNKLDALIKKIMSYTPFTHRTTVQRMLNGHSKESSDRWLGSSYQQATAELESMGYKPSTVVINQDPHFIEFKPNYKNNEIRQVLIGGNTTLRTGYQLNLTNVSPIGLYNAVSLAPKRQLNKADLGDLQYAVVYGKAIERVNLAGQHTKGLNGDRGLAVLGVFAISQNHAWPTASGQIGELTPCTTNTFFVTPWSNTHKTKQMHILDEKFEEILIQSSEMLRNQYMGKQELVQHVLGQGDQCKVKFETVILTLRKQNDKFIPFNPKEVKTELQILTENVKNAEKDLESIQSDYISLLRNVNPEYKDRGIMMKLNSLSKEILSNEPNKAFQKRKEYWKVKAQIAKFIQKRDAFLREFLIYEIGVDRETIKLLKETSSIQREETLEFLKTCGMDYSARWCIEPGFETIEYQLPLHYQGNSSATALRCFTIQAILFNSYRVAQIKHVSRDKPIGWDPFDEKNALCCRRFTAQERRGFTAKGYILTLLEQSLKKYFCRKIN